MLVTVDVDVDVGANLGCSGSLVLFLLAYGAGPFDDF